VLEIGTAISAFQYLNLVWHIGFVLLGLSYNVRKNVPTVTPTSCIQCSGVRLEYLTAFKIVRPEVSL